LLDGVNLGAEDTSAPYSINWDSTTASNGSHTISARARDAAGNTRTATNITVTVTNVTFLPADINQDGRVNIQDVSLLISKYGQSGGTIGRADINADGVVNIQDASLLISRYGS
jgi:hypothetical protein